MEFGEQERFFIQVISKALKIVDIIEYFGDKIS